MRVSKAEDYALTLISALSQSPAGKLLPLGDFTKANRLPLSVLKRVAARLVAAGLLMVKEGRGGGYKLIRPLEELSAADVIAAFSYSPLMPACSKESHACADYAGCLARKTWAEVNRNLLPALAKIKLSEIMDKEHAHTKN